MAEPDSGNNKSWVVPIVVATIGAISTIAVAWINKTPSNPHSVNGAGNNSSDSSSPGSVTAETNTDQNHTTTKPKVTQPIKRVAPKTFDNPRVEGFRLDSTTWDFQGGDVSVHRSQAANEFCRYEGYDKASEFAFEDLGPNQKLQRFWNGGRLQVCDFCGVPFTEITCELLAPKTFDNPRVEGFRLDSTTWDFREGDASVYRDQAANEFCKYEGYDNASEFAFEDLGPNQKLQRFWNDGRLQVCDFCGAPFTEIICE